MTFLDLEFVLIEYGVVIYFFIVINRYYVS